MNELSKVSATLLEVGEDAAGQRIDNFLLRLAKGVPKSHVYRILRSGEVRVNKGRSTADRRLELGDRVRLPPIRLAEPKDVAAVPARDFAVVFEDDAVLVIDKPAGVAAIPAREEEPELSLRHRLQAQLGVPLWVVHRIDRETAGLVVFSVRAQDRAAYQALFRERAVGKVYEAIAPTDCADRFPLVRRSRIEEDAARFFRTQEVPGDPNSETRIEVLERRGTWTRYRLEPVTGKRHQLRVHMAALGLPLAGDQFYPHVRRGPGEAEDFADPLRLLARGIAFTDPVTGELRRFESRLSLDWPTP